MSPPRQLAMGESQRSLASVDRLMFSLAGGFSSPTMFTYTMLTTILTIVTLIHLANAKIQEYNITASNATRFTNDSFYLPSVVKAHNQLIYISYPRVNNDTSVKLAWSDNRQCEIFLPRIGYLSTQAQSLGNGQVIVALVEEQSNGQDGDVNVRFFVVDLQDNCSYIQFIVNFGGAILYSYKPFEIIPYHDSFDIFAKSSRHCKPKDSMCMIRYSQEGEKFGIRNFDFDTSESNMDLESIHPLHEFDPSNGYVYTSKQRSTIQILDSNLKTIKVGKITGLLISHSVLNGDIGICTNTYDTEDSVECLKVDSRLKIKTRVQLTDKNYFGTRRLYNLLDGSSLIVSLSRGNLNGLVKRFSVDGKLGVATLFQYSSCRSLNTEPQDYFVELKGGVYCFSYACRNGLITHCTNLPIVDRLPSYLT